MITTVMFDLYNPGELIGPAWKIGEDYFHANEIVRVATGEFSGQFGRVLRVGRGPHPQGHLDYVWYEIILQSGERLYVAGWGWLLKVMA